MRKAKINLSAGLGFLALLLVGCGGDAPQQPAAIDQNQPINKRCFQFNVEGLDEYWAVSLQGKNLKATGSRMLQTEGVRYQVSAEAVLEADGQAKVTITAVDENNTAYAETQYEIWRIDGAILQITDRNIKDFAGNFTASEVNCAGAEPTPQTEQLFDRIDEFHNGYAVAHRKGRFFIINEKKEIITNVPEDYTGLGTVNEESIVFYDKKTAAFGIMGLDGAVILAPKYDKLHCFNEGLAAFVENGLWGFMDRKGKVVIKPQFNMMTINDNVPNSHPFNNGLAAVGISKDNEGAKWGYINPQGRMEIPMKFGFANPFKDGKAQVYTDKGKWIWIDTKGTCIKDCE